MLRPRRPIACISASRLIWSMSQSDRLRHAGKRLMDLNIGEPRTVRLIYFFPNDRTPQQDIDAKLDEVI